MWHDIGDVITKVCFCSYSYLSPHCTYLSPLDHFHRAVKPKVARGYPELEFNTAHYKRERGDVKVTPLLHEELVELAVDPRDPIAMPSHIPVPTWHEDAEGIMKMAALQSKGYAVVGVPYKASRAEYPIFGENSDFMFIDCDE